MGDLAGRIGDWEMGVKEKNMEMVNVEQVMENRAADVLENGGIVGRIMEL